MNRSVIRSMGSKAGLSESSLVSVLLGSSLLLVFSVEILCELVNENSRIIEKRRPSEVSFRCIFEIIPLQLASITKLAKKVKANRRAIGL